MKGNGTVGILDHRRTWHYRVHSTPQECVSAFARAFASGGGLMIRAKWEVRQSFRGAVAVYAGRAGLIKGVTMLSARATSEQDAAVGSEVSFEVEEVTGETVQCAMRLSSRSSSRGFTADGRFFRPYMRAVESQLRLIDPRIEVSKAG
jgi:hypothetical protein